MNLVYLYRIEQKRPRIDPDEWCAISGWMTSEAEAKRLIARMAKNDRLIGASLRYRVKKRAFAPSE